MDTGDAKKVVLQHYERNKINVAWLARKVDEHRQTVWNWLNQEREPDDPGAWLKLVEALGLGAQANSELLEDARELALDVLMTADNQDLKTKAANLIREISKQYLTKN